MASITNREMADKLRKMAEILDRQLENGFRAAAYRKAAVAIEALSEPVDARSPKRLARRAWPRKRECAILL